MVGISGASGFDGGLVVAAVEVGRASLLPESDEADGDEGESNDEVEDEVAAAVVLRGLADDDMASDEARDGGCVTAFRRNLTMFKGSFQQKSCPSRAPA